jgi:hypothetical protein
MSVRQSITEADKTAVCMNALADFYRRDIGELKRTKQSGGAALIKKLRSGVREIRRAKSSIP